MTFHRYSSDVTLCISSPQHRFTHIVDAQLGFNTPENTQKPPFTCNTLFKPVNIQSITPVESTSVSPTESTVTHTQSNNEERLEQNLFGYREVLSSVEFEAYNRSSVCDSPTTPHSQCPNDDNSNSSSPALSRSASVVSCHFGPTDQKDDRPKDLVTDLVIDLQYDEPLLNTPFQYSSVPSDDAPQVSTQVNDLGSISRSASVGSSHYGPAVLDPPSVKELDQLQVNVVIDSVTSEGSQPVDSSPQQPRTQTQQLQQQQTQQLEQTQQLQQQQTQLQTQQLQQQPEQTQQPQIQTEQLQQQQQPEQTQPRTQTQQPHEHQQTQPQPQIQTEQLQQQQQQPQQPHQQERVVKLGSQPQIAPQQPYSRVSVFGPSKPPADPQQRPNPISLQQLQQQQLLLLQRQQQQQLLLQRQQQQQLLLQPKYPSQRTDMFQPTVYRMGQPDSSGPARLVVKGLNIRINDKYFVYSGEVGANKLPDGKGVFIDKFGNEYSGEFMGVSSLHNKPVKCEYGNNEIQFGTFIHGKFTSDDIKYTRLHRPIATPAIHGG